ncbi:methyl-accepting chemotaxis protein [Garciella nitratireducens]|uniref:methyl-accepting chemotaxis protein n=1 Tax=Garciella nitratireducens TaxID=218205 RepID=UPI000DE9197D|nr:methyl-accepting chemotaxis protein [Garciella nitratireducens]RBP40659.1 methyl-accepting chemotaxis sensory transducer with Cache sensor [Garciella nitratireducens]
MNLLQKKSSKEEKQAKEKKGSIKKKIIPLIILAIVIPILILSGINYSISNQVLLDNFKGNAKEMTNLMDDNLDTLFTEMEATVNFLAKDNNLENLVLLEEKKLEDENITEQENSYFTKKLLDNIVETNENIFSAYIGTRNKTFFSNSANKAGQMKDYDPSQRPWYQNAMEHPDEIIYTEPYESASTGKLMITIAKTLKGDNGEILGVLGLDVTLDDLSAKYKDIKMGDSGRVFVMSPGGMVLIHPDKKLIGQNLKEEEVFQVANSSRKGFEEYTFQGEEKYISFTTNNKTGWKIGVSFNTDETQRSLNTIVKSNLLIAVICIVIGSILSLYILTKKVITPLQTLQKGIHKAASGDLREGISIDSNDEFGVIGMHFNQMVKNLKELIGSIISSAKVVSESTTSLKDISAQTSTATSEVAATMEQLAQTATSEAEQTENGMTKVAQLSENIDEISNAIKTVEQVYQKVTTLNDKGIEKIEDLTDKTSLVSTQTEELNQVILAMDEGSQKIGEIIQAIKSIAEQTNLLALNASIESARAGEAGRGFAVVAEEIRKLSESTSDSAQEIGNLIIEIQKRSSNAVSSIGDTKNTLGKQIDAVHETKETFEQMYEIIMDVAKHMARIDTLNQTMTENKQEITDAMTEISGATEETSASTQEVSASTEEILASIEQLSARTNQLSQLADKLLNNVEKFQLD